MRIPSVSFMLACLLLLSGVAQSSPRWIPAHCLEYPAHAEGNASDAETRWNDAYLRGFRAIERGEHGFAESEMCGALLAAREFGPRDWRFAETLDELGLIAFELRDFELAERLQGAAIAEMLLAVGPQGEPLREHDTSDLSPIRKDCRSGVPVYTERLGWILERTRGRTTVAELQAAPWSIFETAYLPLDAELGRRLDWLISQYLLEENLTAAEALTALQREVGG
jgi:hypothetical protein